MKWYVFLLGSSVGKKLCMAVSGGCLVLFLCVHLLGNFMVFAGPDAFNGYGHKLHSLQPYFTVFNIFLTLIALLHITMGISLYFENMKARPAMYQFNNNPGGRTFASDTMPYTGGLILFFTVIHLANFTFTHQETVSVYELISSKFHHVGWVVFYLVSIAAVAIHISHGFWSLFQTFGLNHPDHMQGIEKLGLFLAVVIGLGFGSLPVYMLFFR